MKKLVSISVLFVLPFLGFAQQNADGDQAVRNVVNQFFDAMRQSDTASLRSFFAPGAIMQTIIEKADSSIIVQGDDPEKFIGSVGRQPAGNLDERITFSSVHIDGRLASVITPYQFYYSGNFSHCGVNAFQLVLFKNGWKVQYIIDTRRKTGCL